MNMERILSTNMNRKKFLFTAEPYIKDVVVIADDYNQARRKAWLLLTVKQRRDYQSFNLIEQIKLEDDTPFA